MKTLLPLILIAFNLSVLKAQQPKVGNTMEMTLPEMIRLAQLQSIASFKAQNMYLARYWEFRSFKGSQLPGLKLNSTPINYSRSVSREYDSNTGEYRFVNNETLWSDVGVSINQNLVLTGGQLSLTSDLRRLENMGSNVTDFTTVPVSVRLSQPLNGYNQFRWESKLKPLAFEKAKKTFLSEMENLAESAVNIFFNSISAEIGVAIAKTNLANADTLYNIGKGRYNFGTVTRDELLDLELTYLNARLSLTRAEITLKQARNRLTSFLGLDKNIQIVPLIPDAIPSLKINADKALEMAKQNSPTMIGFEEQLISANQSVARARATNGLSADMRANIGVNKRSNDINELYQPPYSDDRGLGVSVNLPLIDWGERRGQIQMARSDREVTQASIEQAMIDFEQDIIIKVLEFNLQEEQVAIAAKADTIAQLGFEVTKQRFMIDKVDVLKLNNARTSLDNARRAYIGAIQNYWMTYYSIRKATLYDFEQQQDITRDFDLLLQH